MGIFRVNGTALVGVDMGGAKYRGQVVEDTATGEIDLSFEMTVPADVFLVQGTSPMEVPYTKTGAVKVPPAFGDGKPFEIYFAPGSVTMMVKRIPDEYSAFADGITVSVQPISSSPLAG
jgi:hypothetical protein